MKRILLNRFPPQAARIFLDQQTSDEITLVITYTNENFLFSIQNNPGIDQFCDRRLARGVGIDKLPWLLSYSEIGHFQQYEGLFLSMASRYDINGVNFLNEEKVDLYYRLINFWLSKLKAHKIDTVYHFFVPHDLSSFALHLVSKYLQLTTLWPDFVTVMNKYRFFVCSFTNRNLLVQHGNARPKDFDITFSRYVTAIKDKTPDALPLDTRMFLNIYKNDQINVVEKLLFNLKTFSALIPISISQLLRGRLVSKKTETWWKCSRDKYAELSSDYGYYRFLFAVNWYKIKIKRMRSRYHNLCSNYKNIEQFIYFAAPLQPEASTLPAALHARRLQPLLKMISDSLPVGVTLLYKENAWLFSEFSFDSSNWKPDFFYDELLQLGNVKFVREDVPTFDLIDASIGTVSINGTVAIESVISGKYGITVAPNWYDGLDGILKVNTCADVKTALVKMRSGSLPAPASCQLAINSSYFEFDKHYALTDNDTKILFFALRNAHVTFQLLGPEKFSI